MRNALSIGLVTFIVVVGASWCVSWYIQAENLKKSVESWVAYINANAQYITYDSLETSGFPKDVKITLTNPRFSGRIDQIAKKMDTKSDMLLDKLPQWREDFRIDGTLALTVNALSNYYLMEMQGTWRQHSDMDGKPLARIKSAEPLSSSCALQMRTDGFATSLWSLQTIKDAESFFEQFHSVNCAFSSYATIDASTGKTFMSAGPSQVYILKEKTGDTYHGRLRIKYEDMEFTEDGEVLIMAYTQVLMPDYHYPSMYALYGKQSAEIDLTYKGPDISVIDKNAQPFEINLAKLQINNDLYSANGHFLLNNESTGADQVRANLNMHFASHYTNQYDTMLETMVQHYITHVAKQDNAEFDAFSGLLERHTAEQLHSIIKPALPKLAPLGAWVQSIHATYEGKENFSSGTINLADFAFATTPYGITGSGNATRAEGNPFPDAHFTFQCSACTVWIDDMSAYLNQVLGAAQRLYPEDPNYTYRIPPNLVYGIKNFLAELSNAAPEENAKGNYVFAITSDKTGNMMISGKNFMDVMTLYQQHIAAHAIPAGEDMPQSEIPAHGWKVE